MPARRGIEGSINANELYTASEIEQRLGVGRKAIRELFKRGLPRHQVGKRCLILGRELIATVTAEADGGTMHLQENSGP